MDVTLLTRRPEPGLEGLGILRCPLFRRPRLLSDAAFASWAGRAARDFDLVHAVGANSTRMDVSSLVFCHAAWRRAGGMPSLRGRLEDRANAWMEKRLLDPRRVRRLVAISERVRREALEHLGFPGERVILAYPGVDAERFRPDPSGTAREETRRRLGIPEEAFLLVTVGVAPRKGFGTLLEALDRLPPEVRLLATGERPLGLPWDLRRPRLVHVGMEEEPSRLYQAADALVTLPVYEPFGLTVLEAMATGLPVVVARTAGASELLTHGVDGLIVEDPLDAGEAVRQVSALLGDRSLGARLGAAARETALRRSWDLSAEETFRAYKGLWDG